MFNHAIILIFLHINNIKIEIKGRLYVNYAKCHQVNLRTINNMFRV